MILLVAFLLGFQEQRHPPVETFSHMPFQTELERTKALQEHSTKKE